jgi:DNA-binding transcriptional MerR regulator
MHAMSGALDPMRGAPAMGLVEAVRLAEPKRGGGGGFGGGGSGGRRDRAYLSEEELAEVEKTYAEGISAVEVVDVFASRGIRFSEATFRKYVQQGLLPRSRRVGRKGKNRGSMGVYPPKTVRRVNSIKRLMSEGYTIEEIQAQFLRHTDLMESIDENVGELLRRFEEEIQGPRFDSRTRRSLERELSEARKTADDLLKRIDGLSRRIAAPEQERFRSTGAAGSAEDLL